MKSTIPVLVGWGLVLGGLLPASAAPSEALRKTYQDGGETAFTAGKFGEAERLFHLAMCEADKSGVQDTDFAASVHGRARAFDRLGMYTDAEVYYQRALALHVMFNGSDSEYVAHVRDNLATVNEKLAVGNRLRTQDAVVEFHVAREDFESAEAACTDAMEAARQAGDPVAEKKLEARLIEIKNALKLKPHVDTAIYTLSDTPGDKKASLVLGRFLCFVKQDWENGLPVLAVAADVDPLYSPAQWDSRKPETAQEQIDVADRWFNLTAEGAPGVKRAPAGEQAAIRQRALYWYRSALEATPGLQAGFDKVKAQRRVEQLSGK